jgi:flagellar biosynthesis protein FlhA
MKKADLAVAGYVLAAFIMLIVPIPSGLLDVLLCINMAVAFTIMFGSMFAKEALDKAQKTAQEALDAVQ